MPFVIQPLQSAFQGVGARALEVAATLRAAPLDRFFTVAVPLARRGFITGAVLAFAHTLGEFGVVLMLGGNIPGRTQTASIVIYNHVEAFDYRGGATAVRHAAHCLLRAAADRLRRQSARARSRGCRVSLALDIDWTRPDFQLTVDCEFPSSGITALFGRSGSGKTTLLRCIAGLEHAPRRLRALQWRCLAGRAALCACATSGRSATYSRNPACSRTWMRAATSRTD
jgi:hypothetical protein